jgi:predicted small lipoprotein YifL
VRSRFAWLVAVAILSGSCGKYGPPERTLPPEPEVPAAAPSGSEAPAERAPYEQEEPQEPWGTP